MKKTALLITCGIVLSIVAGYYVYDRFLTTDPAKPWDLVPADAILVYEKNNCHTCLDELSASSVVSLVEAAVSYKKPVDSIRVRIAALLKDKTGFLISVHATKKDDFDLIYYLPGGVAAGASLLPRSPNYKQSSREFNSVPIIELKYLNQVFSYTSIDGILIGSFTPFLIEDVIRTYKTDTEGGFKKRESGAQGFSSIQDDAGNLYIRLKVFSDWLSLFVADQQTFNYALGESTLLDIKSQGNSVVLNGFSYDNNEPSQYLLSTFHHQSPVTFGLRHLVSNRAVAVSSYGVNNGAKFKNDLQDFVKKRNPMMRDTLAKLSSAHNFGLENLYSLISDEFAVCFLESEKGRGLSEILLVESKQPEGWIKTLNQVSEKLSVDTVFYEKYAQYEIREIPVFKFSEKLLWPFVNGFTQNFYTTAGNVVLIADNLEELKKFLDDIEAEDTWGKSVAQNRFLESTLLESNFSLYVNPARAWNVISPRLQPRWMAFVKEHRSLLQSLQMSSIQFSHLNNNYYTNILVTYKPYTASKQAPKGDRLIINFDRGLQSLYAVKNHVNRSNEILIQDSLNDLSFISSEGKALWKVPIGDKILSEVSQIDFFNNGKLQFFFSTQSAIYIIDRLGNYVEPYPLHFQTADIEHVSVLDYDNSKRYRILVADKDGKLRMYDKQGNPLEGWAPKDVGGGLAAPPRHHRIKGKDYILAIRKDGQVYLMNRRGENLKRFPMSIDAIPSGDYALEVGNTIADTYFVVISRDGFRMKFTIEGKVQSRETLLKTAVTSNFSLLNEKTNRSYLILQQDGKQLTISDEMGKKVITNTIAGVSAADVKYFDFGSGNVFVAITDRSQGLSYVYDMQGNLLTTPPVQSSIIELRPFNSEQMNLFYLQDRALVIQPL